LKQPRIAIVKGDIKTLQRLLRDDPHLIRRTFNAPSIEPRYFINVSANGVEGYRQKTPKNIVAVTEVLLKAGAEVDAEADVYGGGATTLGLVAYQHPSVSGACGKIR
jgi:hypothetical protein